jgi:hypothetical protein
VRGCCNHRSIMSDARIGLVLGFWRLRIGKVLRL